MFHNYRRRPGLAPGDPRYDGLDAKLPEGRPVHVPTVTLDGALAPFTPPGNGAAYRSRFTGPCFHRTPQGIGHNVPREAPEAYIRAVLDADRM
ncbi:alpha/beta fold hydrolase [Streptomyces sp. NPDC002172]